ncbi:tRNA (guanosine(46)-N7)-methyltransferase TrmB [Mycoplasma sp. ATU-Cv-508]|uniref:tRNA (guanosine(46)-N7)-methyltransferase TrmB n=1 Tax=Mycoplasma sp. ATU-Cv-508 TaxID=2048001 RepID=UPI000FDD276D
MHLRKKQSLIDRFIRSPYLIKTCPYQLEKDTILEIGTGKGAMLVAWANYKHKQPFVGLEKNLAAVSFILNKIHHFVPNLKIMVGDAEHLPRLFQGKLAQIWLTFPDPWPKKRHAKRRLTDPKFLKIYQAMLRPGGILQLKTDNRVFFDQSLALIQDFGLKLEQVSYDWHAELGEQKNFPSEYEVKWSKLGSKINFLRARF